MDDFKVDDRVRIIQRTDNNGKPQFDTDWLENHIGETGTVYRVGSTGFVSVIVDKKGVIVFRPEELVQIAPESHKFKVWHIPQIPGDTFNVYVKTLEMAYSMECLLAEYDLFLLESKNRSDFSNASGIMEKIGDEWEDIDRDDALKRLGLDG